MKRIVVLVRAAMFSKDIIDRVCHKGNMKGQKDKKMVEYPKNLLYT